MKIVGTSNAKYVSLKYIAGSDFSLSKKIKYTLEETKVLYIIDSIILILLKAITYNLYIYNQREVTQLINIYFFLCFYNLLSRTL